MDYARAKLVIRASKKMIDAPRIIPGDIGERDAREALGELLGQHAIDIS